LIEDDPGNLDTIQQWQDESLRLSRRGGSGGERQEWWEGFLASYYKIALPLGLRPTGFLIEGRERRSVKILVTGVFTVEYGGRIPAGGDATTKARRVAPGSTTLQP